jgi:HD-like signal output (HDOD) protein
MDEFFEQAHHMPMLPKVVQEVMQLLHADDVDIKPLANKIHHDQVLCARVLCLSNAAYFGFSRKIGRIEEAISLIGLARLEALVVASGVTSAFSAVPGVNLTQFWQHSLITASIARQLATTLRLQSDTAYIAGLMHRIGQLPMYMAYPQAAADIEIACAGQSVLTRHQVEQAILGVDHHIVGEQLAKQWHFPEVISNVVRYYTDPLNEHAADIAAVVYAAVHIASGLDADQQPLLTAATLHADVATKLGLEDGAALAEHIVSYRVFVAEAKAYL